MRLVAVAAAVLIDAQGQIAVALDALLEDQDMRGAIHRLQGHPFGLARDDRAFTLAVGHLVGHREHVFAVFAPMARLLPLAHVHQLRRLDFLVARAVNRAAHIGLEFAPDGEAVRVPEHAAVGFLLQMEQVHLLPQPPVIALGGLLQPRQMRIELLLAEPAGTVDAGEHRVLLIAAPVCAGDAGELESGGVELAGGGQVRPAAHVVPVASRVIDRELLAGGQFRRPFRLEALARRAPLGDQRIAGDHFSGQRLVRRDDLAHFRFDGGQVFFGELAIFRRKVIVEPIVGGRAEGDLRPRKQRLHRFGEDMGIIVPGEIERLGLIARGNQRQRGIAGEWPRQIDQLAIDPRRQRRLGEAGADGESDIGGSRPGGHLAGGTVGQGDGVAFGTWGRPLAASCPRLNRASICARSRISSRRRGYEEAAFAASCSRFCGCGKQPSL